MRYGKWIFSILLIILVLPLSGTSMGYDPMPGLTTIKISDLSDTFLSGVVKAVYPDNDSSIPLTINKLDVKEVYFDKIGNVAVGDTITVITEGGFITNKDGQKIRAKVLNSPELTEGAIYIMYLRRIPDMDGFRVTTGESSVFEVDTEGRVLNIHGHYIMDVVAGKPVAGHRKESKLRDSTKAQERAPSAMVVDIKGNEKTIEPARKNVRTGALYSQKSLTQREFLEKVKGARR